MPTPPAVYGLYSELQGWREVMNCSLLFAKTEDSAERLAKRYPNYRPVRLVPEGSEVDAVLGIIDERIAFFEKCAAETENETVELLALDAAIQFRRLRYRIEQLQTKGG